MPAPGEWKDKHPFEMLSYEHDYRCILYHTTY
jgi:hypothetical protein